MGSTITTLRIPRHIGFIPDGNRRWAACRGLPRDAGYAAGIEPALQLMELAHNAGIQEITAYGFTKENVRRPSVQIDAFRAACVEFSCRAIDRGAALRIIGDAVSPVFPPELRAYSRERSPGHIRANLLVNYGWQWDIDQALKGRNGTHGRRSAARALGSADVSRIDLVVRWGGRHRLSGFLPLQCAYADFFSLDTLWPDMCPAEFEQALAWYSRQDVTLGG